MWGYGWSTHHIKAAAASVAPHTSVSGGARKVAWQALHGTTLRLGGILCHAAQLAFVRVVRVESTRRAFKCAQFGNGYPFSVGSVWVQCGLRDVGRCGSMWVVPRVSGARARKLGDRKLGDWALARDLARDSKGKAGSVRNRSTYTGGIRAAALELASVPWMVSPYHPCQDNSTSRHQSWPPSPACRCRLGLGS